MPNMTYLSIFLVNLNSLRLDDLLFVCLKNVYIIFCTNSFLGLENKKRNIVKCSILLKKVFV